MAGLQLEELEEEITRLKTRKSELEDIIRTKEQGVRFVRVDEIGKYLQASVELLGGDKAKEEIPQKARF